MFIICQLFLMYINLRCTLILGNSIFKCVKAPRFPPANTFLLYGTYKNNQHQLHIGMGQPWISMIWSTTWINIPSQIWQHHIFSQSYTYSFLNILVYLGHHCWDFFFHLVQTGPRSLLNIQPSRSLVSNSFHFCIMFLFRPVCNHCYSS